MFCDDDGAIPITRAGLVAFGEGLPSQASLSVLSSIEAIAHISSGSRHAAVTCASGCVYTLGRTDILSWWENGPVCDPTFVTKLASLKIVQTACGYCTTFFLTDKGELYACGDGLYGSLGLGCLKSSRTPVLVNGIPPVGKIVCGGFHTMILTTTGQVWGCGYNQWGELGLGHCQKNIWDFTQAVDIPQCVLDISCGSSHTALMTYSGELLMAGCNISRQLGLRNVQYSTSFKPVPAIRMPISAVACGQDHTVVLTMDGTVFTFGKNITGCLGIGRPCDKSQPLQVCGLSGYTISRIIAGYNHTALLSTNGDLLVCGQGDVGELGLLKKNIFLPSVLQKMPGLHVPQIVFGRTYTLLLVTGESSISEILPDPAATLTPPNNNAEQGPSTSSGVASVCGVNCAHSYGHAETQRNPSYAMTLSKFLGAHNGHGKETAQSSLERTVRRCTRNSHGNEAARSSSNRPMHTERRTGTRNSHGNEAAQSSLDRTVRIDRRTRNSHGNEAAPSSLNRPMHTERRTRNSHGNEAAQSSLDRTVLVEEGTRNSHGNEVAQSSLDRTVHIEDDEVVSLAYWERAQSSSNRTVNIEDDEAVSLTYWERVILVSLECPVCFKVMSAPIRQCLNGHNMCEACYSSLDIVHCPTCCEPFINGSNVALERLAQEIQLPCLDCLQRMSVATFQNHARVCAKRRYSCPLDQTCGWSGRREAMLTHASTDHRQQTWQELPQTFCHSMSEQTLHTDLLVEHNELFTFHRKFGGTEYEAQFAVRYVGPPEDAGKFRCKLEFNAGSVDWNQTVLIKISSYEKHSLEDFFHPKTCVTLKKDLVYEFLKNEVLPCKISILNVG